MNAQLRLRTVLTTFVVAIALIPASDVAASAQNTTTAAPPIDPVVVSIGALSPTGTAGLDFDGAVVGGATSDVGGGWFVTSLGEVFSYGGARHHGSMSGIALSQPIVAMASTPSGRGYWLVASDGGIFAFGDAGYFGSTGNIDLYRPVVDMAPTPSGNGYWLVADDGGVFSFGDARYLGSMGAIQLDEPLAGIEATDSGRGYWLVALDGGVFAFGDAEFFGSHGGRGGSEGDPTIDLVANRAGTGYHLITEQGQIAAFGGAQPITAPAFDGSPVVAAAIDGAGIRMTRQPPVPITSIWQAGGLTSSALAEVSAAVASAGGDAVVSHGGTLRVLSFARDGSIYDQSQPGWQMPFTIRAVDPAGSSRFFGGDVAGTLGRGEVVMSASSAALRGARAGDVVTFIGWDDRLHSRQIGSVVPDSRTGATELMFSVTDAATFGFSRPSSLWVTSIDDLAGLAASVVSIGERHDYIRSSNSWEPSGSLDGVPSTMRLKELLGEFEYRHSGPENIEIERAWTDANIVRQRVPIIGTVTCHRAVMDDLTAALATIEAQGLAYLIDLDDTRRNGGCWVPRRIRGTSGGSVSRHSWGTAIDINPATNAWGTTPTIDQRLVDIFRAHGFAWGGTWTRPDGMHFEWNGSSAIDAEVS